MEADEVTFNPGHRKDPIRQQGFGLNERQFREQQWFQSRDHRDFSRLSRRRRAYHATYQCSSGHSWDQFFDEMSRAAYELEAAGIDLGWGGAGGNHEIQRDMARRYSDGPASEIQSRFRSAVQSVLAKESA